MDLVFITTNCASNFKPVYYNRLTYLTFLYEMYTVWMKSNSEGVHKTKDSIIIMSQGGKLSTSYENWTYVYIASE